VTLAHGLIPLVVPQVRTITRGAVTGLGIEATSFRSGLPHESVLEMDILTGNGEVVTAAPEGPAADLFATFPNSYGSLGYATRIRIELEAVPGYVDLRHVRLGDLDDLPAMVDQVVADRAWEGVRVDSIDGVVFDPTEAYLTLATWRPDAPAGGASDYTGQEIYYRSLQRRSRDVLTIHDYLWRWDTDWFWCRSGAQHHLVTSVAGGCVAATSTTGWSVREQVRRMASWTRDAAFPRGTGVRTSRSVERTPSFLRWFDERGMRPVWLCPLRLREPSGPGSARRWRRSSRHHLHQRRVLGLCRSRVGFGVRAVCSGNLLRPRDLRPALRRQPRRGQGALRSRGPAHGTVREGGETSMTTTTNDLTVTIGEAISRLMPDGVPFRFTAYDGSCAGPDDAPVALHLCNERGLSYLLTAPGDLGLARVRVGDLVSRRPPG
jgi:FAD/FMN-containing dehydrogenase